MGSGTWTITKDDNDVLGNAWTTFTTTNLTFDANTSTIKFTKVSTSQVTLNGGGLSFNNLWFARTTATGINRVSGANTFNDLKDTGTAAHTIRFTINTTTTISTFSVSGQSGALITLDSSTGGTAFTLSCASGIIARNFLSIKDSTATGGALFYAGSSSVNTSGNTGWIFTDFSGGGFLNNLL